VLLEIVLFTVVGIVMYAASDYILSLLERLHGEPLPQRNIVFFVLILTLSLSTFSLLRGLLITDESPQDNYQEQQSTN